MLEILQLSLLTLELPEGFRVAYRTVGSGKLVELVGDPLPARRHRHDETYLLRY